MAGAVRGKEMTSCRGGRDDVGEVLILTFVRCLLLVGLKQSASRRLFLSLFLLLLGELFCRGGGGDVSWWSLMLVFALERPAITT